MGWQKEPWIPVVWQRAKHSPQCTWVPFAELPQPALVRNGLPGKLPEYLGVHASFGEASAKLDIERLKGKESGFTHRVQ